MTDIMAEFGVAQEIHVIASKIDDSERQVLIQRAKRIDQLSPAAGKLLRKWMEDWNKSCQGLTAEEVPDTDDECRRDI